MTYRYVSGNVSHFSKYFVLLRPAVLNQSAASFGVVWRETWNRRSIYITLNTEINILEMKVPDVPYEVSLSLN